MRFIAIALLGALAVVSCSKKEHASATVADAPGASAPAAPPAATEAHGSGSVANAPGSAGAGAGAADHRKVVRTGRVELLVASYDEARRKLDALLEGAGGYVDSTRVGRHRGAVSEATLSVRVPSGAFAGLLPRLARSAR